MIFLIFILFSSCSCLTKQEIKSLPFSSLNKFNYIGDLTVARDVMLETVSEFVRRSYKEPNLQTGASLSEILLEAYERPLLQRMNRRAFSQNQLIALFGQKIGKFFDTLQLDKMHELVDEELVQKYIDVCLTNPEKVPNIFNDMSAVFHQNMNNVLAQIDEAIKTGKAKRYTTEMVTKLRSDLKEFDAKAVAKFVAARATIIDPIMLWIKKQNIFRAILLSILRFIDENSAKVTQDVAEEAKYRIKELLKFVAGTSSISQEEKVRFVSYVTDYSKTLMMGAMKPRPNYTFKMTNANYVVFLYVYQLANSTNL